MKLREARGRDPSMFVIEKPAGERETVDDRIKKEWNGLPMNIRLMPSITTFKTNLKTYFFGKAFLQ